MRNVTTHTGTLTILGKLKTSRNGNPRYRVAVAGYVCTTRPDSMLAYELPSLNGTTVHAHIGAHYNRQTLASAVLVSR